MSLEYSDLHLCPDENNIKKAQDMILNASKLGYVKIAISYPENHSKDIIMKLNRVATKVGIDLASRLDLNPKTRRELMNGLRKNRRKFEIISVICQSKLIARKAATDRRVDLLNFSPTDPRKRFFDESEARLASSAVAAYEIDIKPLLLAERIERMRLLSTLRKEVCIAHKFRVPIVISSGATNKYLMRNPRENIALTLLFDIKKEDSIKAISKNPATIIERNREKMKANFLAPGIRIIKELE